MSETIEPSTGESRDRTLKTIWDTIWKTALTVIITTLVAFPLGWVLHPDPGPEVSFTAGGDVPQSFAAEGTAANIPDGHDLWLVVESPPGDQWFPQGMAPLTLGSGSASADGEVWQHQVFVGQPNDAGKPFGIVAILTTEEGSKRIEERLETHGFAGIGKGDAVWEGAETLSVMTVRRF